MNRNEMIAPTDPAAASRAAVSLWLALSDNTGLVPVVFPIGEGFEPGYWPRARLEELPEGAWVIYDRAV
jgi:hypothetical protein